MIYLAGIRDLVIDMISINTTLRFKKMRLFARIPRLRNYNLQKESSRLNFTQEYSSQWLALSDSPERVLEQLLVDGFAQGLNLTEEALRGLIDFCDMQEFSPDRASNKKARVSYSDEEAPDSSAIYSLLNPHTKSKIVEGLVRTSQLTLLAEKYLGTEPVLMNSQIWYTFPKVGLEQHHNFGFHYDIDDYRFLKFFFYLDDVDKDTGPHSIIKGSHVESSLFKFINRRLTDDIACKRYAEDIVLMTGTAGSGFAEDTYCYHKGGHPRRRRLILQIQFGVSEKGYFE